ncbi:MAG: diguanylate cyclase [Clostridia bacterium]
MRKFHRILKTIAAPLIAVLLIIAAFLGFRKLIADGLRHRAFETLLDTASQQAVAIRQRLNIQYEILSSVSEFAVSHLGEPNGRTQVFSMMNALTSNVDLMRIGLVDQGGNAELSIGARVNVADRAYFKKSMRGVRAIERVESGRVDNATHFVLSVPLNNRGKTEGIIFGSFNIDKFSALLGSTAYGGKTFSYICDTNEKIILSNDRQSVFPNPPNLSAFYKLENLLDGAILENFRHELSRGHGITFSTQHQGETYYVSYIPLGISNWFIANVVPKTAVGYTNEFINTYSTWLVVVVILIGLFTMLYIYLREGMIITQLEEDKELLCRSEQSYELVLGLSNEVFFRGDLAAGEMRFNQNFETVFGRSPHKLTLNDLKTPPPYILEEDRDTYLSLTKAVLDGLDSSSGELRVIGPNGQYVWQNVRFLILKDANNRPAQVLGKLTNIDHQKHTIEQLKKKAESDPLTHLMNRNTLREQVEAFIQHEGSSGLHAFFMIDIDNFKKANDTLGHRAGDTILTTFAAQMQRLFRTTDFVCRMGGDEFAVFLKNVGSVIHIQEKAQEVCNCMRSLDDQLNIHMSASVGISLYHCDGSTFDELYDKADQALYRAKADGKNQYVIYAEMDEA